MKLMTQENNEKTDREISSRRLKRRGPRSQLGDFALSRGIDIPSSEVETKKI